MNIDINLTFVAELVAFFLFVFCIRNFVVPHIVSNLEKRRTYVNTQLALLDTAEQSVLVAQQQALSIIESARLQAVQNMQAFETELINERIASKQELKAEIEKMRLQAQQESQQMIKNAELAMAHKLQKNSISLAAKIISKNISAEENEAIIKEFLRQL
jgi:F-type H+-transporting ATPase subunit b